MLPNDRMKRGIELEPFARGLYEIKKGESVQPRVLVKDFTMASLDGISACGKHVVEIKCPGERDHCQALAGKVPDHYYPQLQHQMYICGVDHMDYFSFDGADGVIVQMKRDDAYIENMIQEEKKFYQCILQKIEPEIDQDAYLQKDDERWKFYAECWKHHCKRREWLDNEEKKLRAWIMDASKEQNCKGHGISVCKIERKGNVDYAKIPELKGIDLDMYRKASTNSWRITSE